MLCPVKMNEKLFLKWAFPAFLPLTRRWCPQTGPARPVPSGPSAPRLRTSETGPARRGISFSRLLVRPGSTVKRSHTLLAEVECGFRKEGIARNIHLEHAYFLNLFSLVLPLCFESFFHFLEASTCLILSSCFILFSFSVTDFFFCLLPLIVLRFLLVSWTSLGHPYWDAQMLFIFKDYPKKKKREVSLRYLKYLQIKAGIYFSSLIHSFAEIDILLQFWVSLSYTQIHCPIPRPPHPSLYSYMFSAVYLWLSCGGFIFWQIPTSWAMDHPGIITLE